MEIKDLILSASKKSWKMSSTHGTEYDRLYKSSKGAGKRQDVINKVWERDRYKCHFCFFESKKHQEIHHLNDDHDDYSIDNLVTVCPLCHQSFHLDIINGGKVDGVRVPPYGVDVMRFWIGQTDYTNDVPITPKLLEETSNTVRKIRNTARYMLGNLSDYDGIHINYYFINCS